MRKLCLIVGLTGLLWLGSFSSLIQGAPFDIEVLLPQGVPGLQAPAHVVRDVFGIPHVFAGNDHDLYLLTGYVQAQDRLFQMDLSRRQASGTLAELLGADALPSDVQLQTLGLRRAAALSLEVLSPETRADLEAYAQGVNAVIDAANTSGQLPPEYSALELTQIASWSALDSVVVAKGLSFQLSFDLDIDATIALQGYITALGPQGGTALFSEDLFRSAPANPATSVPDAEGRRVAFDTGGVASSMDAQVAILAQQYRDTVRNVSFFEAPLNRSEGLASSNWVLMGASHSATGNPMLASDPHLGLNTPSVWYEIDQKVNNGQDLNVAGVIVPGIPYVTLGFNDRITWAATVNALDVTDTFFEAIVPGEGGQLFSIYQGQPEPLQVIPVSFNVNVIGDGVADHIVPVPPDPATGVPPVVLVVPRHGPIINLDLETGTALSVQYTGFYATREAEAFRLWNRASNVDDFKAGLQLFDVGSQNWAYADVDGTIAYFSSAEIPLRQDLEQGFVDGNLPPWVIRDGTGTLQHEWITDPKHSVGQSIPFAVLPFAEMPQTVNPANDWIVNANNDPIGTTLDNNPLNQLRPGGGIYYLAHGYARGFRAGRLMQLVRKATDDGSVTLQDMIAHQADVTPLHAQIATRHLLNALAAIGANPALAPFAADPRLSEVTELLASWDYSHPTGLPEGFDFNDSADVLGTPSETEIRHSAAATVFNVWFGQLIKNTIDGTMDAISPLLAKPPNTLAVTAVLNLLEGFKQNNGVGVSGVPFFNVPGAPDDLPAVAKRDIILIKSLQDTLDLLSGEAFAPAFNHSQNLLDYRWGLLHRIVLRHPLGPSFSVPPLGSLAQPEYALGVPVDGGWAVVDRSDVNVRGHGATGFMFSGGGPSRRFVAELTPNGINAFNVIPGGISGVPGALHFGDQVRTWLANEFHPAYFELKDIFDNTESWQDFFGF